MAAASSTRRRGARPVEEKRGAEGRPGTGARKTVVYYIKQLPRYVRLLGGLLTDRRVSAVDSFVPLGPAAAHVLVSEHAIEQAAAALLGA